MNYLQIFIFKVFKVFVYLKCFITVNLSSTVINHLYNIYSKYIIILVKCFSQKYKKNVKLTMCYFLIVNYDTELFNIGVFFYNRYIYIFHIYSNLNELVYFLAYENMQSK